MHPIERLRFLARAGGLPAGTLVQEAAGALASFADEPQGFLTACQRVVARQPGSAPLVWLVARALSAMDPYDELWTSAREMDEDPTGRLLADALPGASAGSFSDGMRVVVVGGAAGQATPLASALHRRGDLVPIPVDPGTGTGAEGEDDTPRRGGPRSLRTTWWEDDDPDDWADHEAEHGAISAAGLLAATERATVVLVEAEGIGPDRALTLSAGATAAACGRALGVPVWLVGGVGRQLGPRMWDGFHAPFRRDDPWHARLGTVPLSLVDAIAGPAGVLPVADALALNTCPECPEVFRGVVM